MFLESWRWNHEIKFKEQGLKASCNGFWGMGKSAICCHLENVHQLTRLTPAKDFVQGRCCCTLCTHFSSAFHPWMCLIFPPTLNCSWLIYRNPPMANTCNLTKKFMFHFQDFCCVCLRTLCFLGRFLTEPPPVNQFGRLADCDPPVNLGSPTEWLTYQPACMHENFQETALFYCFLTIPSRFMVNPCFMLPIFYTIHFTNDIL